MASIDPPTVPDLFPPALVQFVFKPDPFLKSDFPRSLSPAQVEAFVRAKINPSVSTDALDQLFLVVDHYDVHEVVAQLLKLIEPSSAAVPVPAPASPSTPVAAPASPARRLSVIKTAAVAGAPAERARAADLFRAVASDVSLEDRTLCERLVDTYEAASLELDATAFLQRLNAAAVSLARFETSLAPGDAEKRQRYGDWEALRARLQSDLKVANSKRSILALPDRPQRIRVLVRAYLDLPVDYPGYLVDWAARRLRRETWALQPSNQVERTSKPELRAELAAAFRAALPEIDTSDSPEEIKKKHRVTALDAVLFFSGALSPEESKFVVSVGEGYVLPLSLRQEWPQP